MKPDLVIHPLYANILLHQYQLDEFYNVILLDELPIDADPDEGESFVIEANQCTPVSVVLMPFYDNNRWQNESGMKSHITSYHFVSPTPLYRVKRRAPRYVIWTRKDPLTICATYIDRVGFGDLYGAVCRAKQWSYDINVAASVIVFDLDRTLIDDNDALLQGALDALIYARQSYDYVVLWSHGSPLHVEMALSKIRRALDAARRCGGDDDEKIIATMFDLVLSNEFQEEISNKNLLHLYNYFINCTFERATLVDDSVYNWTPEYDRIIIPRSNTLTPALPYL